MDRLRWVSKLAMTPKPSAICKAGGKEIDALRKWPRVATCDDGEEERMALERGCLPVLRNDSRWSAGVGVAIRHVTSRGADLRDVVELRIREPVAEGFARILRWMETGPSMPSNLSARAEAMASSSEPLVSPQRLEAFEIHGYGGGAPVATRNPRLSRL